MFMQKIRHATKKHRTVLIVVVALLAVGIVGTFAVWDSNVASVESDEVSYADMVAQYEEYLKAQLPAEGEEVDFDTANALAEQHMVLSTYAMMAASEASSAADSAAVTEYMITRMDAASSAADYFQKALDLAPDTMNEAGKAGILSDLAYAQYYATNYEDARTNFEAAYEMDANIEVVQAYSEFLFNVDGLDAVEEMLNAYMGTISDAESNEYTTASSLLEYYTSLDALYSAAQDAAKDDEDAEGNDADTEEDADAPETADEPTGEGEEAGTEEGEGTDEEPIAE